MSGSLGVTGTILLFGNTASGRGEVRWKYFKVKTPTLGFSAVQGEVKKICIHDLPGIFGYRYVKFMTEDERADAVADAPEDIDPDDEDSFIIDKCAEMAGMPSRLTNILMFCFFLWSCIVRTIQGDSDNFDTYVEDLRLFEARVYAWASIWKETQRRINGKGSTHSSVLNIPETSQVSHTTAYTRVQVD